MDALFTFILGVALTLALMAMFYKALKRWEDSNE
jgi:hypothetical protein